MFATSHPSLQAALLPTSGTTTLIKNILLAVAGSLLLWVSAKISVPMYPVPMTMQTMVLFAIALAYGWKLAGATVLLYLAEGAVGIPVFANTPAYGIGLPYMLGTTGGFLIGFPIAAVVVGWLAERGQDRNFITSMLAMIVGLVIVYVIGVAWLSYWTFTLSSGKVLDFGVLEALKAGVTPYFVGDLVKCAIVALAMPLVWKLFGSLKG